MNFDGLTRAITDAYPTLSPQLRLAAKCVLERPDDVALQSMRGFASSAGVKPSTMLRLARSFSFDTYGAFRAPFQHRMRSEPGDFADRARDLQARRSQRGASIIDDVAAAAERNTRQFFKDSEVMKLHAAASVLNRAGKIVCIGRRSSYAVAHVFAYIAGMFRNDVRLLDGISNSFNGSLRNVGEGDAMFAVGVAPYSVETVAAVRMAEERGIDVVALTDSPVSPIRGAPETTLIIPNESPSFFQSVAQLTLAAETLAALMVAESGRSAISAIEQSERELTTFLSYWPHTEPEAAPSRIQGQNP